MSRNRRPAPKKSSRPPANPKSGPPDQPGRVITQVLHEEHRISGPLPTPDILLGYDEVLPGAAERIMRMVEKEQASAHEVEGIAVRAATADNRRGQIFGFLVALMAKGRTKHILYFKQTAYNWLNFCRTLPPCFDANDRPISHTKVRSVVLRQC